MDISLHYEESGAGAPLLLLHGNSEDHTYFSHQIPYFSRHFRTIALDTRGHGASPRGHAPFTIAQFAEDLHDFLCAQGIRRVHLLGFSDGGNIALTFALRYPHMVDRLILNGANLCPAGVRASVQLPILLGYGIAACLARFDATAQKKKELLGLMVHEPHIAPDALRALPMPVLVIAGRNDMIRRAHTEQIAHAIPNASLVLLPGDHFIAARSPDAFNHAVGAFLGIE